jgi:hypothetical protein
VKIAHPIALPIARPIAQYGVAVPDGFGGAVPAPEPPEFFVGGDFASADGWTLGAGWSIAAGAATNSGAVGNITRPLVQALIQGNSYIASFSFTDAPAEVFFRLSGGAVGSQSIGGIATTPFSVEFVAAEAWEVGGVANPDGEEFSIDDLSLVPAP